MTTGTTTGLSPAPLSPVSGSREQTPLEEVAYEEQVRSVAIPLDAVSLAPVTDAQIAGESPTEVASALPGVALIIEDFSPQENQFGFHDWEKCPVPWRRPIRFVMWVTRLLFGLASLVLLLAVLAALPIINIFALGYLLEAEGRVARTGKLRYALPLMTLAPRLGMIVLGLALCLLPVMIVADVAADARLIAPGEAKDRFWSTALFLLASGLAIHALAALARGGHLITFFRPIKNIWWLSQRFFTAAYWNNAAVAIREFFSAMKLGYHWRLGLVALLGTAVWLLIPTLMFAALNDRQKPGQVLLTLVGGVLLLIVLSWLPLLQARLATEGRWKAMFELKAVRRLYARSPMCWTLALVLGYALSLPLYLFKTFAPPGDLLWMFSLIFIATIYPARIIIGWVYARSMRLEKPAHFLWRWLWSMLLLASLGVYVFLLFFAPAIGVNGRQVLFEHPLLMLPVPL
ncbi:MAG: hypothetical protein C0478_15955 [Planctomyces sp.]|nr:hypothetical protein [Planctomyces sp.]